MKEVIADTNIQVNCYQLTISTYGTKEVIDPRYRYPVINIFQDPNGTTGDIHAQLFFYLNDAELPVATYPDAGRLVSLAFHLDKFDFIMSLLTSAGKVTCSVKSNGNVVWGELDGPKLQRKLQMAKKQKTKSVTPISAS